METMSPARYAEKRGRASFTGCRVLVVEDEVLLALDVQLILAQAGCIVVGPCASADQALTLMDRVKLDCAVVDLTLRGGTGHSVADILSARHIPFIIWTGRLPQAVPKALRRSPIEYKPCAPERLLDRLAEALCSAAFVGSARCAPVGGW